MSAYTDSNLEREKIRELSAGSFRSNQSWTLITGTLMRLSNALLKKAISRHCSGSLNRRACTGIALMYLSAFHTSLSPPSMPRMRNPRTSPLASNKILSSGLLSNTLPPLFSIYSCSGWHSLSGKFPSRNAFLEPFVSLRNRFKAVSTTVADSRSGSMKASALDIATKISCSTSGGAPVLRSHSEIVMLSASAMYLSPPSSAGSSAIPKRIFCGHVSMSELPRMATRALKGPGRSGKSKRLKVPGRFGMANTMLCFFHCSLS
mmetsp:Transcript_21436/g.59518  ORF Transcript_21436/g.59518 Transcript_21436/m.59518 type:complete len:262 (+) Transcript_21436:624-1409(+)